MEGEAQGGDTLLQKLRDSRHRFQKHMQQLLEKYNQPFEDDPLVQMSTLTYKTPKGWRFWGGRMVRRNKGQTQVSHGHCSYVATCVSFGRCRHSCFSATESFVTVVDRKEGSLQASGDELSALCTEDLGVDSESSGDSTLYQEDLADGTLTPAVPWSPLKDELRRKYLTQVDILLQDKTCSENDDYGEGNDTRVSLAPSLPSPPRPAHGYCDSVSEESLGGPFQPAASSHPCSADLSIVPRNDSVSFQETSGNSTLSSQSFVPDICSITISDLYPGMLHSMSRLLSAKPACVISTKTFIVQNWSSRRRHKWKRRLNRTYYRAGRHARASPPERREPMREVGILRDCQNLTDASGHKAGLKLGEAFLEVNKPRIRKLDPSWKELKGTPQKLSSLTYVDSRAMQNRLMTLKWLISPVKVVCRPRILQGEGGNHSRELGNRFERLYQEYCFSPRKQPCLASLSCAPRGHVCKGGSSPGSSWGLETHRPSRSFGEAKPKILTEAFANLGQRAAGAASCLARSRSFPLLCRPRPTQSPGCAELPAGLSQGNHLGVFRKSVSPSKPVAVPRVQPPGSVRDRYSEIKEKFDQLHQKYSQKSPPRMKAPLYTRASLDEAIVEPQNQEDFFGKLNPDSGFQGPQKLSPSPQWSVKRSLDSATTVHPGACCAFAARCSQHHTKRCRLSDPQVCGRWAAAQRPPHAVGGAILGPEAGPSQTDRKKKRKEEYIFQD